MTAFPADSADARDQREAEGDQIDQASLLRPLPRLPRRSRRGETDAEAVLAERRALVDGHPLGELARAAARAAVWPYRGTPATSVAITVEDAAVELLTDAAWVRAHADQATPGAVHADPVAAVLELLARGLDVLHGLDRPGGQAAAADALAGVRTAAERLAELLPGGTT